MRHFRGIVWIILGVAASGAYCQKAALRRSDVVFFVDDQKQYEAYGCTVVGWGGYANAPHIKAAHEAGVRLLAVSVPFRTAFNKVIDFSDDFLDAACRDFSGQPFAVPWLWDHKYKDQPYWWACTNSPLFREWLSDTLAKDMAVEPDGLHIDDYTGTAGAVTWLSGGFCDHCMAAFREYVKRNVPAEKLAELGVRDPDTFNYRTFLVDQGVTPEEYKTKRESLPLAKEFMDSQAEAVTKYVRGFHEEACRLRGKRVTLSVNSGLESPLALMIAPYVDYFCCEVGHHASEGGWPTHPVYIYKLADALRRPVAAMASGQDHAWVAEHNSAGLLRTWIVTAYTHGQAFTAPVNLWCYTEEKGTHWYKGPEEEYAWMFKFIRNNAELFDGYETVAPVAVLYDNAARRAGKGSIEPICNSLANANVPFAIVVAGDNWLDYRLTPEAIAPYEKIIVAELPEKMDAEQRAIVEGSGRLAVFTEEVVAGLPHVSVDGGENVSVVLRVKPGDTKAPVVCHVHSERYDAEQDAVVPQDNIVLHIPRSLLPKRDYGEITDHCFGNDRQITVNRSKVESKDDEIVLSIPRVGLWNVVVM